MKKMLSIICFVVLCVGGAYTPDVYARSATSTQAYSDGSVVAQAGFGYGLRGSYGDMKVPPIWFGVDYNVHQEKNLPLSFGGFIGYAKSEEEETLDYGWGDEYTWKYTYSYVLTGVRTAYHFSPLLKVRSLDLYAGLSLGYAFVSSDVEEPEGFPSGYSSSAESSYFLWGLYGGVRYFITDAFGAFLEAGFGAAYLSGGVCYKF